MKIEIDGREYEISQPEGIDPVEHVKGLMRVSPSWIPLSRGGELFVDWDRVTTVKVPKAGEYLSTSF